MDDILIIKKQPCKLLIHKKLWSNKIYYKQLVPRILRRYAWVVNTYMPLNENLRNDRTWFLTFSGNTYNGNSHFGTSDTNDLNDFRIFWQGLRTLFFMDSGSARKWIANMPANYNDFLSYRVNYYLVDVYKNNLILELFDLIKNPSLSGTVKQSGGELALVSKGNESLNFYEFKVYDTNNNLLKHYIPLEDGHTLYDVVSNTKYDVGKTYNVFVSTQDKNAKGEDIPGYYYDH